MLGGAAAPDPFLLSDSVATSAGLTGGTMGYRTTSGRSPRAVTINPAQKTLIYLSFGQSLRSNILPTLVSPANPSVIHNFNIYDGNFYDVAGPLLGTTYASSLSPPLGPGNPLVLEADKFIVAGFDQVVLCSGCIGGTTAAQWGDPGGPHADRGPKMIRRLAARGITPATPGTIWLCEFAIGNQDLAIGTSQAAFMASAANFTNNMTAAGFNGRFFIPLESGAGQTSNAIRSAQAALVDNTNIFSNGDFDSSAIATSDSVHPNNAGGATQATISYNAKHASGAPY